MLGQPGTVYCLNTFPGAFIVLLDRFLTLDDDITESRLSLTDI